ncbi:MAG: uroporphyrinogen decarboxylase [Thermoplasmataceae archaeon]
MYLLEKALQGIDHDTIPVWFMRQAGRYSSSYREYRSRYSFKEMCLNPEIVADITLSPVERLGVDAAIIFSDITLPAEAMGFKIEFIDNVGPTVLNPLSREGQFHDFDSSEMAYPLAKSIQIVRERNVSVPIIGFVGGPLTIASYLVDGRPDPELKRTKKYLFSRERAFMDLMDSICEMVIELSKLQIGAGCSVIQIFDSWAGNLSTHQLLEYADRYLSPIASELSKIKVIYFSTQTGGNLKALRNSGFRFFSVDWRTDMAAASISMGDEIGLQGNLDPVLASGPLDVSLQETHRILDSMKGKQNYIFNLGHGVLPETPEENLKAIVEYVHSEAEP